MCLLTDCSIEIITKPDTRCSNTSESTETKKVSFFLPRGRIGTGEKPIRRKVIGADQQPDGRELVRAL